MIEVTVFNRTLIKKSFNEKEVERLVGSRSHYLWLNLSRFTKNDLDAIKKIFKIHPLTLEDITNSNKPKYEKFKNYTFLTLFAVKGHKEEKLVQVSFVIGKNFVLSFNKEYAEFFKVIKKDEKLKLELNRGVDFLLHSMIDTLIEGYFPLLEDINAELEKLQKRILQEPTPKQLKELFEYKNKLFKMRTTVHFQRDVIGELAKTNVPFIGADAETYFKDIYDHLVSLGETIDSAREMIASTLEIHLSVSSNKMNEVMKILTIFATIMLPLTAVGSIYGMNFRYMPELEWKYGYFMVLGFMALISATMLYYFKKKDWM